MASQLPVCGRPAPAGQAAALPLDFWQLYKSYKRDTGYVLDWLRATAVENVARSKKTKTPIADRLPVRDILRASELVSKRKLTAPHYVRGAFRRTLLKRRQLNEWYRQFDHGDARNESHEFFNDTLAKSYDLIFAHDDKAATTSETVSDQKPSAPPAEKTQPAAPPPSRNFYVVLADIEEKEPESPVKEPDDEQLAEVPEPKEYVIEDDPLAEVLDLHIFVLEMDSVCSAAKQYWDRAAHGDIPVALAGWLTTAGFAAVKQLCDVISPAIGGHRGLIERYTNKKSQLAIAGVNIAEQEALTSGQSPTYQGFSNSMGLTFPVQVLTPFKLEYLRKSKTVNAVERKPISGYFTSAAEEAKAQEAFMQAVESTIADPSKPQLPDAEADAVRRLMTDWQAKDKLALESTLKGIAQLINTPDPKSSFKKEELNPLLSNVRDYLQSSPEFPATSLVFGTELFLETCKSFVWKGDKPNPVNGRMSVLKFAQEVEQAIQYVNDHDLVAKNHTMPTMAGLIGVSDRLKAFLKEKRFDLYAQAPWTAGLQTAQILTYATEAGLSLCNQRGIVGTVLHAYNAVQQLLKAPAKNPLLDALSSLFVEQVFLGRAPTSNFDSIWLRFLGGGIEKKNIRGSDGKKFSITLPKRPTDSQNSADFKPRIDAFDLSLFHNLCVSNWTGGPTFWAPVFTEGKKKTASRAELERWDTKLHQQPFGHALDLMQKAVRDEFSSADSSSLAVARTNFFAVYTMCVDMLTEVSRRAVENPPKELEWARAAGIHDPNVDAAAGFGFVALLLMDVDSRADKGARGSLAEHSGLQIVQEAVAHAWGDKTLDDFVWKNL